MRLRRRRGRAPDLRHVPPEHRPVIAAALPELERLEPADRRIVEQALPFSLTGVARLQALVDAVRHVVRAHVRGDFAECGVWRGGSILAMILTLQDEGVADRDIHLYDTFEGMTPPTEADTSAVHPPALDLWRQSGGRPWAELFAPDVFNEQAVRACVLGTGYPEERVHFVRGAVEETLPEHAPEALALLRLDTDWYESTRHELRHLYPRLVSGGLLIVDDYGEWEGCRRAVDEYLRAQPARLFLARIDHTGRVGVKP